MPPSIGQYMLVALGQALRVRAGEERPPVVRSCIAQHHLPGRGVQSLSILERAMLRQHQADGA